MSIYNRLDPKHLDNAIDYLNDNTLLDSNNSNYADDIKFLKDCYNNNLFKNELSDHTKKYHQALQEMYLGDSPMFSEASNMPNKVRVLPKISAQSIEAKPV